MHTHEQRMELLQHLAQLRRNPLRKEQRNACSDSQKLNMRNFAEATQQVFEFLVAEQKWVSTTQQHVPDSLDAVRCIRSAGQTQDENHNPSHYSPIANGCNSGSMQRTGP